MTAVEHRTYTYVGTRPVRHDGLEKVTGKARFAADLDMTKLQETVASDSDSDASKSQES